MTPQGIAQLKQDEGLRLKAYKDTLGNWTIGFGHLMVKSFCENISEETAEATLYEDVEYAENSLSLFFDSWTSISPRRKDALINLVFNIGMGGFTHFRKAIDHIRADEWPEAAEEFKDSLWFRQLPKRAERICKEIKEG